MQGSSERHQAPLHKLHIPLNNARNIHRILNTGFYSVFFFHLMCVLCCHSAAAARRELIVATNYAPLSRSVFFFFFLRHHTQHHQLKCEMQKKKKKKGLCSVGETLTGVDLNGENVSTTGATFSFPLAFFLYTVHIEPQVKQSKQTFVASVILDCAHAPAKRQKTDRSAPAKVFHLL